MVTYRSTCRSCGGQLYVIGGTFTVTPVPIATAGFSLKHQALSTSDEVVRCVSCDTTVPLVDCELRCSECDDEGWVHVVGRQGAEIQRCDSCSSLADDEAATAAHAHTCGCGWGLDWYRQLYRVTIELHVAAPADAAASIRTALDHHVGLRVRGLVTDVAGGGLMQVCSGTVVATEVDDPHPSRGLLVKLGALSDP